MLHGKTPRDIIAVLADIGNVVWSNNDYKYPIVSATGCVHEELRGVNLRPHCARTWTLPMSEPRLGLPETMVLSIPFQKRVGIV